MQLAFAMDADSPYRPAAQFVQLAAAERLYVPAAHGPVHDALDSPAASPNRPAAHGTHTDAPAKLYWPAGHFDAVLFKLPSGHAYPAVHSPLQLLVASRNALPKRPPGHTRHTDAPLRLYCPGTQADAVALVEPPGQKYPALPFAVQLEADTPADDPYRPAGHAAVQLALAMRAVAPYRPMLQSVQLAALLRLYCPAGQLAAVAFTDMAGQ